MRQMHNSYNCKDFSRITLASMSRLTSYLAINGIKGLEPTKRPKTFSLGMECGSVHGMQLEMTVLNSHRVNCGGVLDPMQSEVKIEAVD